MAPISFHIRSHPPVCTFVYALSVLMTPVLTATAIIIHSFLQLLHSAVQLVSTEPVASARWSHSHPNKEQLGSHVGFEASSNVVTELSNRLH